MKKRAVPNVVRGQHVSEGKRLLAKELRQKMTPAESAAWQRVRRNQLGLQFRRQQAGGLGGRTPARGTT